MLTTKSDHREKMVLETDSNKVWTVAFHPDGIHVFGGMDDGIRRWRLADGQEVGKQTGMDLNAISMSRDHKWVVCGTSRTGASVWDTELREKVIEVEGAENVYAVDVASDCTRFATGTGNRKVTIWSITTGERLVGPLEHGGYVRGVKFSPDGGRLATACSLDSTIRIFNAHNGNQLISIKNPVPGQNSFIPIAWLMDGERFLTTATDSKIKLFNSSTGSQLVEWKIHDNDDNHVSIALDANNKFIASCAGRFVSFWDSSTHTQIGINIVEDTDKIRSIALSPDGSRLASGSNDSGRINIWDLHGILPGSYLSTNVSITFLSSRT